MNKSENILFQTGPHWITLTVKTVLIPLLWAIACFAMGMAQIPLAPLIAIPIAFIPFGFGLLKLRFEKYTLTNHKISFKTGLLVTRNHEIFVSKIESSYFEQGILGKILGYGTLVICGTGGNAQRFPLVAKVNELQSRLSVAQGHQ